MPLILHIIPDTSTELMTGAKSRKWVHQKPTNQPTWREAMQDFENLIRHCAVYLLTGVSILGVCYGF